MLPSSAAESAARMPVIVCVVDAAVTSSSFDLEAVGCVSEDAMDTQRRCDSQSESSQAIRQKEPIYTKTHSLPLMATVSRAFVVHKQSRVKTGGKTRQRQSRKGREREREKLISCMFLSSFVSLSLSHLLKPIFPAFLP